MQALINKAKALIEGLIKPLPAGIQITEDSLTNSEHAKRYYRPQSLADEFPYERFDPEYGLIRMISGKDAGALLEITPVPTDGLTDDALDSIHHAIHLAIREGIPEEHKNPWIVQYYVHDEESLIDVFEQVKQAINPEHLESQYTQNWLKHISDHLDQVVNPNGVFNDPATRKPWRGKSRRVFCCMYRFGAYKDYGESANDLTDVLSRFESALSQANVRVRRCTGRDMRFWMLPWLSPNPPGESVYDVLKETPVLDEMNPENIPFGYSLTDDIVEAFAETSSEMGGIWTFDDIRMTALSVTRLSQSMQPGQLTGERMIGDSPATLMDFLPSGTRVCTTITVLPQFEIDQKLEIIREKSVGNDYQAANAKRDIENAMELKSHGEKIYPMEITLYVRDTSADERDLEHKMKQITSVLRPHGLNVLNRDYELVGIDQFLKHLPFLYDYQHDQKYAKRSMLHYASDIAAVSPLFGRTTGTGSPGLMYFNRSAEPLMFDPLKDRVRAAHMAILGPTGSGKSAYIINALMNMIAVHKPRIFIIDPKWPAPSFTLFLQHCEKQGLSTHHIRLTPQSDVSIPPFITATDLVSADGSPKAFLEYSETDDLDKTDRDLMGEMILLAVAMINESNLNTGIELNRADKARLQTALQDAASRCVLGQTRANHVLPEDLVQSLLNLAEASEAAAREKILDMANSLTYWTQGLAGKIFNEPGHSIPDADVVLFELGVLANDGYEDEMSVAFMSLMQHIQGIVTEEQFQGRENIVVADELHVIARNPAMGRFLVKIVKVWRSVGCWFWPATQNVDDMDAEMQKMLDNLEYFIALSMPKDEVRKLAHFIELSDEERSMFLSAKKSPGQYAEGVVKSPAITALFRAVVPPITLALSQTEQYERAARQKIVDQHKPTIPHFSHIDAAYIVAEEIANQREHHAQLEQEKPKWQQ